MIKNYISIIGLFLSLHLFAAGPELVYDGGFENTATGQIFSGATNSTVDIPFVPARAYPKFRLITGVSLSTCTADIIDTEHHGASGTKCLKITVSATSSNFTPLVFAFTEGLNLTIGHSYTFKYAIKVSHAIQASTIRIGNTASGVNDLLKFWHNDPNLVTSPYNTWKEFSFTYIPATSGSGLFNSVLATAISVQPVVTPARLTSAGGPISIYIDNMSIVDETVGETTQTLTTGTSLTNANNFKFDNLVIESGATITTNSGYSLSASKITNYGTITNNGTLDFLSDATNGTATIIGSGTIGGTGTVNVNQSLQHPAGALRSWYVSPPVASFNPTGMSAIKFYDETNANGTTWTSTSTMLATKGYSVTPALAANNLLFTGALNTGSQNIVLTSREGTANKAGFNLIGNPYLSYLDWNDVIAANSGKLRSTTMWYRTKNGASYNFWTVNGDGIGVPNGASVKIPPMQAFWVRANAGGSTLNLTDAMRYHAPTTDKLLKAPAVNERTLIRLQVNNGVNADEAVLYFSENASNGLDKLDAPKMSNENENISEIYTSIETEKMVINSMNTIPLNSSIGVGFVAGAASSFSIKANEITNIPEGVKIILRDNEDLTETDLTDGTATYNFTVGTSNSNRFSLLFRAQGVSTGLNNTTKPNAQVYVNATNQIVIIAPEKSNFAIYNAMGQIMDNGQTTAKLQTVNCKLQTGVYLVKVNNQTTRVIVK